MFRERMMDRILQFSMCRNYVLYYGHRQEEMLSLFDMAVVDPAGQTDGSIQHIKKAGTLVIGYLSVLEICPWSREFSFLKKDDYLQSEGQPLINPKFNNYWVDLRSESWTNLLLHKVSYFLNYLKYDGVFFDTLGYIEENGYPLSRKQESIFLLTQIVRRIRETFPRHILIQNGGLAEIIQYTSPFLNAVCWENPPDRERVKVPWLPVLVDNLNKIKSEYNIQILLLTEGQSRDIPAVRKMAKEQSFLAYHAKDGYTGKINIDSVAYSLKKEGLGLC
ncbi:MAG: endo alpha-1,4 polygalactosaminidase [Peptococcaceae bacterium]|nr:endo alpha-1,4 polygalactosaminidase [Peptococcaceae bacterium]